MGNKASAAWNVISTQQEHIVDIIRGKSNNTEEQDVQLYDPINMLRHPFTAYVPRALVDQDRIVIQGKLAVDLSEFSINLICDHPNSEEQPKDIAYHFKVDYVNRKVVANRKVGGEWTEEEDHVDGFDFEPGMDFEMVLIIDGNMIETHLDTMFHSSMGLMHSIETVKYIQVLGDVDKVSALKFEFA